MIRLYQTNNCPYSHRVRIVLAEKELDYQSVPIDLLKQENKTDQFLRLNPLGQVPVLADEDLILSDSYVINEYLNEEYPFPELLPEDSQQKALARNVCFQIEQLVAEPFKQLYLTSQQGQLSNSPNVLGAARERIYKFLELAERTLKSQDYLVGTYSLADISFAPFLLYFERYQIAIPDHLARLKVWFKRLNTRNTIVKTR